jgi:hypothetical protein
MIILLVKTLRSLKEKCISLAITAIAILAMSGFAFNSFSLDGAGGAATAQFEPGNETATTEPLDISDFGIPLPNWTGSILTSDALLDNVEVGLLNATQAATDKVGEGSMAVESSLRTERGYLVWIVQVIDPEKTLHQVIVDPSTGNVLEDVAMNETLLDDELVAEDLVADDFFSPTG